MKKKTPRQIFEQVDRLIKSGATERFPWIWKVELKYICNMAHLDNSEFRDLDREFSVREYMHVIA